ncbi:YbaK/EbsC family protein [Egicoccus halophilus]|uniref:Aminoacyl-tRNA deacylase n=1 Tax=Egicoccus halophilus TaxID=1670830 RepID=A0A8J3AEY6_9ACTN|nr:YbaK/EbsC family protein [Egicoccus halophilus]GGI06158.1 aminoacyl-tRNA deacylase [Egicoccus halophilus]
MATAAVERFTQAAAAHGLAPDVREFPQGTRTAADAAAAIGCDVAQIVKSLVFMADDEPVLVLTSGANRVDEDRVRAALGAASFRKGSADEVRDATGYAIGGTPPFGHAGPLRVVCDRDLTAHEEIWAAAGTPSTVFPLVPTTLLTITGAEVVDVC